MHQCRPLSPVFFSGSRAKLESFCHLSVRLSLGSGDVFRSDSLFIRDAHPIVQNYFNLFTAAFVMPS